MARVGYKKVRRGSGLGTRKVRVGGVGRVQGRCGAGRGSGLGKEGARGIGYKGGAARVLTAGRPLVRGRTAARKWRVNWAQAAMPPNPSSSGGGWVETKPTQWWISILNCTFNHVIITCG